MKVYVVTSGSYSDYGINAIFSTPELAELYKNNYNKANPGDADIEEWELDKPIPENGYTVRMTQNGIADVSINFNASWGFWCFTRENKLVWNIQILDKERAIKVVNEKRAQILALGIWGNNARVKEQVK